MHAETERSHRTLPNVPNGYCLRATAPSGRTGEHPCRSVQCSGAARDGDALCSPESVARQSLNEAAPWNSEHIYFMHCPEAGAIKVGRAKNPGNRLRGIQTACPLYIYVLATAPGGAVHERMIHSFFKEDRIHGEWFRATPDLIDLAVCLSLRAREQFDAPRGCSLFLPAREALRRRTSGQVTERSVT